MLGPLYQFNADAKMPRNGTVLTYDRGFSFVLDPPLSHGGTALKVPGSSPVDSPMIFSKVMTYQFFYPIRRVPTTPPRPPNGKVISQINQKSISQMANLISQIENKFSEWKIFFPNGK